MELSLSEAVQILTTREWWCRHLEPILYEFKIQVLSIKKTLSYDTTKSNYFYLLVKNYTYQESLNYIKEKYNE